MCIHVVLQGHFGDETFLTNSTLMGLLILCRVVSQDMGLKMNLLDLLSAVVAHFESMYGPHVAFKGHFVVGFEAATLLRTLQVLRPVLVLHVVSVLLTPRYLLSTYLANFGPGLIPQSLFVYPAMGPNQMFLQVAFPHETRTTKLTGNLATRRVGEFVITETVQIRKVLVALVTFVPVFMAGVHVDIEAFLCEE